jgi:alkylhydroperoxidase family enzyme
MAIGLAVARETRSPYVSAHMARLLRATEAGRTLLANGGDATAKQAVAHAVLLTRNVQGPDDAGFAALRARFNDAQIVEMTMTACFFQLSHPPVRRPRRSARRVG